MTENKSFDLIVIGGGTGGNGVARMAANAGWRVASVDCESACKIGSDAFSLRSQPRLPRRGGPGAGRSSRGRTSAV